METLERIAKPPGSLRARSGKILRRLLKARELGLPEGDLSTLEAGTAEALSCSAAAKEA